MTKTVLSNLFAAARETLRGWPGLAIVGALYALTVAAFIWLITTREATAAQVALTFALAAAVPLLFFATHAAAASHAVGAERPGALLRGTLRNLGKVFVISLPLLALLALGVWGSSKLEARVLKARQRAEQAERARTPQVGTGYEEEGAMEGDGRAEKLPPVQWKYVFLSTARLLFFGLLLPLAALQLWLAAAREGLRRALFTSPRVLWRAYSVRSVFTYALGMIVFALLPYLLVAKRTPVQSGWLELTLMALRLALAFAVSLFGWLMTARALANLDRPEGQAAPEPTAEPRPRADVAASPAT